MKKKQVMEYDPSLVLSEYKVGNVCIFIHNIDIPAKEIPKQFIKNIKYNSGSVLETTGDSIGGIGPEEAEGGIGPEITGDSIGGIGPEITEGGIGPEITDDSEESVITKDTDTMSTSETKNEKSRKKIDLTTYYSPKKYCNRIKEAGIIIGIDEYTSYMYVQFDSDIKENKCHIFAANGAEIKKYYITEKIIDALGK